MRKIISFDTFNKKKLKWSSSLNKDLKVKRLSKALYVAADKHNFCYLHSWLGEPMLQTPDDIITIQEIMFKTKPDIVIEVGVAWAGTLLLYETLAEFTKTKKIIGIDIFIPKDLKKRIFSKKKTNKIKLISGDSTSEVIFKRLKKICGSYNNILIHLDSNHTKEHVLKEIELYSKLIKKNNYLIVGDTIIEHIPKQKHRKREWGKGNNPANAITEFLKKNKNFKIDKKINFKQLLTNNPNGYLKRIR
jgi:cephalosporin hydroxylase